MSIETLETYINRSGYPILRRCFNCVHWDSSKNLPDKSGLCTLMPLYFSFTLQKSVFHSTKEFYLCEKHKFKNEDKMAAVCEKTLLKDALKNRADIDCS